MEIQASSGTENLNLSLQTGRVRVDVNPPAGTKASMTVSSPSATASVRGTGFDFDGRNLNVNHGSVGFQGNHGVNFAVNAGTGSTVQPNGRPTNPHGNRRTGFNPSRPVGTDATGGSDAQNGSSIGFPVPPPPPPDNKEEPPKQEPSKPDPPKYPQGPSYDPNPPGGEPSGGDVTIGINYELIALTPKVYGFRRTPLAI
jgi:hypothetical protein